MKHSKHYFTSTRLMLYALFLGMIPTGANAQLFGGMIQAQQPVVPPGITLGQKASYFVTSVYDNNYTPYKIPTGPATTNVINVGGGNPLVDVQGTITTTGVTVSIPVTCTGNAVLKSYFSTTTISAGMTQDGIARDLILSWNEQACTTGTKAITATLKAVGGPLNAKKLDVNAGIGSDYLGVLLGQLVYPYNNASATTNFAVRDISGIPDKMYGLADNAGSIRHNFLYLPVNGADGKIWLNNNLGAAYADVKDPAFNPPAQATSGTDILAYGSLFQWGRKPDGHELYNWLTSTGSLSVYGKKNNPTHPNFIMNNDDWHLDLDDNLWLDETSINNPCPSGWRLPTATELIAAVPDYNSPISSVLKFTMPGKRAGSSPSAHYDTGLWGYYWASSTTNGMANILRINTGTLTSYYTERANGNTVRCVLN